MRNFSFVILFLISFILAFIGASRIVWWEFSFVKVEQSLSWSIIETSNNRSFEPKYQEDEDNINFRLMIVTLLSTIFAVFFVYSGFKIDTDLIKMDKKYKKINQEMSWELEEAKFYAKLNYWLMFFNLSEYQKWIDFLVDLKNTLINKDYIYTCYLYIAQAYYNRYRSLPPEQKEDKLNMASKSLISFEKAKTISPEYFDSDHVIQELSLLFIDTSIDEQANTSFS